MLSEHFDDIKIISYIRRQDQLILSFHQESSKADRLYATKLIGASTKAIPPYSEEQALYLDYNHRLGLWGDVFGDDNIIIRKFDGSNLVNKNVVDDFYEILGISNFKPTKSRNVSRNLIQVKLGHIIYQVTDGKKPLFHQIVIKQTENIQSEKQLPPRSEAQEYYSNYLHSNTELNERFKISETKSIFKESFSAYPKEGAENWTEETANQTTKALVTALEESIYRYSEKELVTVAKLLTKKRPKLAVKFLEHAQEMKPKSADIMKKLEAIKEQPNFKRES